VMGNSEVGHQNIGAGRIVNQEIVRITKALLEGEIETNDVWQAAIKREDGEGLRGYLRYIEPDGSIQNTCQDCRSPGDGTIAAYLQRKPIHNDRHGFGPVILAFGAGATRLGLETL